MTEEPKDIPDEWTPAIKAAKRLGTINYDLHRTALEMVGNRHSKASLVWLVYWLLAENDAKLDSLKAAIGSRDSWKAACDAARASEKVLRDDVYRLTRLLTPTQEDEKAGKE